MSAITTITRHFRVNKHRATLRLLLAGGAPVGISIEWSTPHPPRLTPVGLREYRAKRNEALRSIANEIGEQIVVVDFGDAGQLIPIIIEPEPTA